MPHPSFTLWQPVVHDDGRACSFDAVAMTAALLQDGSAALISDFLTALRIDAQAERWALVPFRSAFYGRAEAEHWDDRLPAAWRITVWLANGLPLDRVPFDFAGTFTNATDETAPDPWASDFAPPERTTTIGTILAAFPGATPDEVTTRVSSIVQPEQMQLWPLKPDLTMLRIN